MAVDIWQVRDESWILKVVKGAYLADANYVQGADFGSVAGKIVNQITAFNRAGISCEIIPIQGGRTRLQNVINWAPFLPSYEQWDLSLVPKDASFLYIRKPMLSGKFVSFLRQVKQARPELKIILEIPTYPYDKELHGFVGRISLMKERYWRKRLYKYVDRIADLSQNQQIFEIKTLPIINGIDLETTEVRKPSYTPEAINIVSASGMRDWHGLDRALYGLAEYYQAPNQKKPIVLHLAGSGEKLDELKALAAQLNIEEKVRFYGELKLVELAKLYDSCTVALESLGCHRKDLELCSSIKSREYLAKGMPFIYSAKIDVFDDTFPYCLKVPADDTPLDFDAVVDFHEQLYSRYSEAAIISNMRDFAEENVTVDKAMQSVIEYAKSE